VRSRSFLVNTRLRTTPEWTNHQGNCKAKGGLEMNWKKKLVYKRNLISLCLGLARLKTLASMRGYLNHDNKIIIIIIIFR